jgi:hypothetical protein
MPRFAPRLSLLILACFLVPPASPAPGETYEAYTTLINDYPSELQAQWTEECQGLTHDDENWFISKNHPVQLWKIPVQLDLNTVTSTSPGVLVAGVPAQLSDLGYNHYGDPTYHAGYIFMPIEGGPCPGLAAFNAGNLAYVSHCCIPGATSGSAWCAADPTTGNIYGVGSCDEVNLPVVEYRVEWSDLREERGLDLDIVRTLDLRDEGGAIYALHHRQGGAVTPGGQVIFICSGTMHDLEPWHGIHVFDLETGHRITRSTNGYGRFNFEWDPAYPELEEPEGMTIWDLDGGQAPGIYGQLHVVLLDNDISNDDDVYLKHYRGTVYAATWGTVLGTGTPTLPLRYVSQAADHAWSGSRIIIGSGSYPETVTIDKFTTLEPWDEGSVVIGEGVADSPPR